MLSTKMMIRINVYVYTLVLKCDDMYTFKIRAQYRKIYIQDVSNIIVCNFVWPISIKYKNILNGHIMELLAFMPLKKNRKNNFY